jgi:hypothetical protein
MWNSCGWSLKARRFGAFCRASLTTRTCTRASATTRMLLESRAFRDYPANRIAALMWASIARAGVLGQRESPNGGTPNDINALSFMPFCDAMFIDNGARAMWEKAPRNERPDYSNTRLFSYNMKDAFMVYLDDIERQADPEILHAARQVYGEPEPFVAMHER